MRWVYAVPGPLWIWHGLKQPRRDPVTTQRICIKHHVFSETNRPRQVDGHNAGASSHQKRKLQLCDNLPEKKHSRDGELRKGGGRKNSQRKENHSLEARHRTWPTRRGRLVHRTPASRSDLLLPSQPLSEMLDS
jgi:hypothetical protein